MGLRLRLRGRVQGIGLRPWVRRLAGELGVRGHVTNTLDGVEIEAFASRRALALFRDRVASPSLPGAWIESIQSEALEDGPGPPGFEIRAGRPAGGAPRPPALAPDLPTCPDCLAELGDPRSRRHRHPFVACARCGPRYTVARSLPWERARTAMADFPLCAPCAEEFASASDRRHHAEATSCPRCGPRLRLVETGRPASGGDSEPERAGEAALDRAAEILRRGGIVAVQGIGGFHLACRAGDEEAVRRLRRRKHRPRRPLAAMVRSLADAEKHAVLDESERALLASDPRPIVLLRRRPDSGLAPGLTPGLGRVGLMLPYSPLHVLLLDEVGEPLVVTSANRSGEPTLHRAREARRVLAPIADALLEHDREIVAPCDDSVAVCAPSGPIWMRRGRGQVPEPVRLARPVERPVLALGGHWSHTICLAAGEHAWVSEPVGDLESPASVVRLEETVARWLEFTGLEPEAVAHDLHPAYESTLFAERWPAARRVAVQHHHAHLAAVLGEHGRTAPALGLIWDGTGLGSDGAAWGGELLLGDAERFERLATFRPIPLAGGERAILEPWRVARAWLRDALHGEALPPELEGLFGDVPRADREGVDALLDRPGLCVPAHGVGRLFDAVASLLLREPRAGFSGELAQRLGDLARRGDAQPYPFRLDITATPWQIDLRPAARALVADLLGGRTGIAGIAERFHATLVGAAEAAVGEVRRCRTGLEGSPRVVLAGGCFQNPLLVASLEARLGGSHEVLRSRRLPPGDGGLAFGQAWVAGTRMRLRREEA